MRFRFGAAAAARAAVRGAASAIVLSAMAALPAGRVEAAEAPAKAAEAKARLPVPDAAAVGRAEKLVREIFEKEYGARAAAARVALATKMLEQAWQTPEDPAAQFVLMRESRDVAASAGHLQLAAMAVDGMAERFAVDGREGKLELIKRLGTPAFPDAARAGAAMATAIADEAALADDFETATRAIALANVVARASRDPASARAAAARQGELRALEQGAARVRAAAETLKASPADPEASAVMGRHLAVVKADWERALPLLAAGSDAGLKAVAARDLAGRAGPIKPEAALALADDWWEAGERAAGAEASTAGAMTRAALRRRAGAWYLAARPRASGLAKLLIEKRLAENGEPPPPLGVAGEKK